MTGSAIADRRSNVLSMLGVIIFANIATLLTRGTTIQIVDIPIIIATLLALLAGQAWGFCAGLVVAAYPSILLASNGLAMTAFTALLGPFAVSTLLRKRGLLLAPGVLIFHAATALVIALHPRPFIDAEPGAALFFYLRDAAGSLLIAALADLFLRSFKPTNFPPGSAGANMWGSASFPTAWQISTSRFCCSRVLSGKASFSSARFTNIITASPNRPICSPTSMPNRTGR
jgi:hypothetical protein